MKKKTIFEQRLSRRELLKRVYQVANLVALGSLVIQDSCASSTGSTKTNSPEPTHVAGDSENQTQAAVNLPLSTSTGTSLSATDTSQGNLALIDSFDFDSYRLVVDGAVQYPLSLTYSQIKSYPNMTKSVMINCPGYFTEEHIWMGVPVKTILDQARIKPEAAHVVFYSLDGYCSYYLPPDACKESVFLAFSVDGQTLSQISGRPLRLVSEGEIGASWVRGVNRIEIR
jgi:DMSO/TMAO reductase YedYZ molybdopterin-dependent catalytic subunit